MMPTFPVPVFASALLLVLAVHVAMRTARAWGLAALIGACAVQALLIALVQHYGVASLRFAQALGASLIPPLAWLALTQGSRRSLTWRDARHAAGPAGVVVLTVLLPAGLDAAIPLFYIGYGTAILRVAWDGADALARARLDSGDTSLRVWQAIGAAMLLSALADLLILAAILGGQPHLPALIVSFVTSLTLLGIGWVALSPGLAPPEPDAATPDPATAGPVQPPPAEEDRALVARLEALMEDDRLYLDPDLTLERLARRLQVPRKVLSAAVNRCTGENVSRFINARRIAHACAVIARGRPVTEAWLASGFNTRSNFNREFRRIRGCAPSAWQPDPTEKDPGRAAGA